MASAAEPTEWPVPDWKSATPASQGMSPEGLDRVRVWLKDHGSKTGLVIRHGRIVGEWYFGDAKPDSQFLVYSTTKSFASTAAGLLIQDGKLALDTKVGSVLPKVSPDGKKEITVRQLLSMSSGVHNNAMVNDLPDRFNYALYEAPMDHAPGSKWDYNNTGLSILSPVIRAAAGKELDQVLNEKLFQPIGMAGADWSWDKPNGHTNPYSGLHITGRSLARFGLLFLNQGKWQDRQLISANWVQEATGPSQTLNPSYGYLWWNNSTGKWPGVPKDAYAALGRFDNNMLIVPSLDLIVIRQVGDDSGNTRKIVVGELWKLATDAVVDAKPAAK
jgi:CubicO group peptidase (beta-lactamase class C family)